MDLAPPAEPVSLEEARDVPWSRKQSGAQALVRYRMSPLRRFLAARDIGDVIAFSLFGQTMMVVHDPKLVEAILVTEHARFIKDNFARQLRQILGQGLLTSEDEHWKRQRKLMAPSMQPREMARYAGAMAECARELVAAWPDGERDVHAEMMHLTLDILGRTLFGQRITEFEEVERELDRIMRAFRPFSEMVRSATPAWVPLPSRRELREARLGLDAILMRIIAAKRKQPQGDDLLSRLIHATDETGGMTDADLRDEAMTLFLAGHETTALALTYTLHLLSEHPEARARVERELAEVLGGRLPAFDDLSQLVVTRAVVQESLRLYPPAWAVAREAREDTVVGGFRIPRGAQIFIPIFSIQRHPRFFDDPERFSPERFLPGGEVERGLADKQLPRFSYFPFGAGPRVCIGQHFAMVEAVSVLAVLIQRVRFTLPPGSRLRLSPAVTLRPRGPVRMRVERRPSGYIDEGP